MIRLILGQPGSGKTVSAVKRVVDAKELTYTNFRVRAPGTIRIRLDMVIREEPNENPKLRPVRLVNWDHWRGAILEHGGFHIFIDELHNIMHARLSMTKQNVLMSQWVAQIRKVTGENERFDFVCISQELERVDVAVRDLTHEIVHCQKRVDGHVADTIAYERGRKVTKKIPLTWVMQTYFTGLGCVRRYQDFRDLGHRTWSRRTVFLANHYFQYYDSYELIDFGETAYL